MAMNMESLELYSKKMTAVKRRNRIALTVTALLMVCLWLFSGSGMAKEERALWHSVRSAEDAVWSWRAERTGVLNLDADPHKTGLIGVEWSPLSTTLGALPAKRTACDPRWSIVISRWLNSLNIERGDSVVLLSSSSFPGLILNTLTALETRGADVTMVLSLGSSTWGANDSSNSWPLVSGFLRTKGFIHTKADFYTPGGDNETGVGLSPEAIGEMRAMAGRDGTPFIVKKSLEDVIIWKMSLIEEKRPKAVISIGGSNANMGDDEAILKLKPGLTADKNVNGGSGVIGRALSQGYPVIHLLNIKELAAKEGIPFDSAPYCFFRSARSIVFAVLALLIFVFWLFTAKRWEMMK